MIEPTLDAVLAAERPPRGRLCAAITGRPAHRTRIESVSGAAWFEAVTDAGTLAVLRTADRPHGAPRP